MLVFKSLGSFMQNAGRSLDKTGQRMLDQKTERLCRHRRLMSFRGVTPRIHQGAWLAPNSLVLGNVELDQHSSVFYGAVLRGDTATINIGKDTVIGEKVVCSSSSTKASSINVGNDCFIEFNSVVMPSKIGDRVRIGSGSVINENVSIGDDAFIKAGSIVPPNTAVAAGEVWAGNPARKIGMVTEQEKDVLFHDKCAQLAFGIAHKTKDLRSPLQIAQEEMVEKYSIHKFERQEEKLKQKKELF